MDRYSLIKGQVFDRPVVDGPDSCGRDRCVCGDVVKNERDNMNMTGLLHLAVIVIAAFSFAFVSIYVMDIANARSMFAKRSNLVSCDPNIDNLRKPANKNLPGNNNGDNGCIHQQSSFCETNNSKRKPLKPHYC